MIIGGALDRAAFGIVTECRAARSCVSMTGFLRKAAIFPGANGRAA